MRSDTSGFFSIIRAAEEVIYKEKDSKFIGYDYQISNVQEIKAHLSSCMQKHPRAYHCCYAYRLEDTNYGFSDDQEPAHSAGAPIFKQIVSKKLYNTLLITVRYFGGTKLGIGGLIRAYKNCAESTLKRAAIGKIIERNGYIIELDYEDLALFYRWIKKFNTISIDCRSNENKVSLIIRMEKFEAIDFKEGLQRLNLNYKTEEK